MKGNAALSQTLQSAATGTGNGVAADLRGASSLTVEIAGTFVGTVTFEGSIDEGTTWTAVGLKTAADGAAVTSATAPGMWKLPIDGPLLQKFRARVSAYTSGSITVRSLKR